jgi:hypothetical protein
MTKIVVNGCFGGFGLSEAAVARYAEIAGITLYPRQDMGFTAWYRVPPDVYDTLNLEDKDEAYFSMYDIDRTDPALVQVVEELGGAADGNFAALYIVELEPGTRYRIDEYDGTESVMTIDDYEWSVA